MVYSMNRATSLTATLDDEGRLAVPAEALDAAGIGGCIDFAVAIDTESGAVTLTAVADDDDDSWADSPQVRADIAASIRDVAEGRVFRMTKTELEAYVLSKSRCRT